MRITTEAELTAAAFVSSVEGLKQRLPGSDIDKSHVSGRERNEATGSRNHYAPRAAHDQGGRSLLASGHAPLHMTGCANVLFQIVVRPRPTCSVGTVKKAIPRAIGDFLEVRSRGCQCSESVLPLSQSIQVLLLFWF